MTRALKAVVQVNLSRHYGGELILRIFHFADLIVTSVEFHALLELLDFVDGRLSLLSNRRLTLSKRVLSRCRGRQQRWRHGRSSWDREETSSSTVGRLLDFE